MRGTLEVALKANLHPRHQHSTNEAQKAEAVLSAVSVVSVKSITLVKFLSIII